MSDLKIIGRVIKYPEKFDFLPAKIVFGGVYLPHRKFKECEL